MKLDQIQGVGLPFNVVGDAGSYGEDPDPILYRPGSLNVSGRVGFVIGHDDASEFANTADGSGRVFAGPAGVDFEFSPPATAFGCTLRNAILGGFDGVSIRARLQEYAVEWIDGRLVTVVGRAVLMHVSVQAPGSQAFASARCWPASAEASSLAPEIASAARRWRIGALARDRAIAAKATASARRPRGRGLPIEPAIMGMIENHVGRQGRAWGRGF